MDRESGFMDLQPHQVEALEKLKNGSILWGGVGVGKTRVAIAYYLEHEQPKNIVVITTAKKRDSLDWKREAAAAAIGTDEDTYYGVLNVDSWNNIDKWSGMQDCFFIFDEQRLVGNGAWVKAFLKIVKNNTWILLSATPGDTWLDYIPVFIANGFYKNRTEFKREHVVYKPFSKFPKVDRYLGVQKLNRLRDEILVHMPYMKETIRHEKIVYVEHDEILMDSVIKTRWNPYLNKPIRDISELFMVMRRVANENTSRLEAVRDVLRQHQRLIVFYNFNYELEALRGLESFGHTVAEWNGHRHQAIPETDSWVYLVQYIAGSEAWDCIETDAMLFYSLTYSYKHWEQAHGRIDRMNTPYTHLWYYILKSRSVVDMAIWRTLKAKRSFNASNFDEKELEW
jgi:superfamily II DNA or RNA helicase